MQRQARSAFIGQICFAFVTSLIISSLYLIPAYDLLERRILDLRIQIRGPEFPHPDIAIVDIDDESVLKMGAWPWPRNHHTDILKILAAAKPSVIFYDVLFSETSDPIQDQAFAEEIKKAGNVILPFYFSGRDAREFSEQNAVFPLPMFSAGALDVGYVNLISDADGHVRQVLPKCLNYQHASSLIAKHHSGKDSGLESKPVWIDFPGPYSFFRKISFIDLIERYEDPSVQTFLSSIQNKIVLVGFTATGTALDLKPTAFSPLYPGIGIQASMVHTFLKGKYIQRLSWPYDWVLLFLFSFFILRLSILKSPLRTFLYTVASLFIFFEIGQVLFQYTLFWIPFFGYLFAAAVLYGVATLSQFVKIKIEREVLSRELVLAATIQNNMLPTELPKMPGLELAAVSLPARQVGGDFYDVVPLGESRCGIVIGDVSGKGVPAALFMAKSISEFRREQDLNHPSQVFQRLNIKFIQEHYKGLFLTLLYLVFDLKQKTITFASAGHEPIYWYQKKSGLVRLVSTLEGPPVGVDPGARFEEKSEPVEVGDILVLISDGVREAMNRRKESFGVERIKNVMIECEKLPAQMITERLNQEVQKFAKGVPQHDDLTVVCVKITRTLYGSGS